MTATTMNPSRKKTGQLSETKLSWCLPLVALLFPLLASGCTDSNISPFQGDMGDRWDTGEGMSINIGLPDTDADTETLADTETGTAADTGDGPDTDSQENLLENGEPCNTGSSCNSGHCGDGFCCEEGECCRRATDCDDSSCVIRICGPNNQCIYNPIGCGFEDTDDGAMCTGDSLCDGRGHCAEVAGCDGTYASQGGFSCEEGSVEENCWEQCLNIAHCRNGAICRSGKCLIPLAANGEACSDGESCESGYCEGGVCCDEGECCADIGQCGNSSCVSRFCDGNSQCAYYNTMPCGHADSVDGDTCNGDSLCDGLGNCEMVVLCTGAYSPTGELVCANETVEEECNASCSTDLQCNTGYYCADHACVPKLDNGQGPCFAANQCESEYCATNTGICCESGWCCDADEDCGGHTCNLETHSCESSCLNGATDDDSACSATGDFHCDDGGCREDLADGAACDESSDCLSGHCDEGSNVCCAAGACCDGDEDCAGSACGVDFVCAADCGSGASESDALCASGYHCDSGACVLDVSNGEKACDEHSDCASGFCTIATGACCAGSGDDECCAAAEDCDDANGCTTDHCGFDAKCVHHVKQNAEPCSDGSYCNGLEHCQDGECQPADSGPCDTLDNGCRQVICDEEEDSCNWEFVNDGEPCTETQFCLGAPKYCQNGMCVDLGNGASPCPDTDGNPCTRPTCDNDTGCGPEVPSADYESCGDGDPCNGNDFCLAGECLSSGNPCEDGDPCTRNTCAATSERTFDCAKPNAMADGESCDLGPCQGTASECLDGLCIPSQERPCNDGNLCTLEQCNVEADRSTSCIDTGEPRIIELHCSEVEVIQDTQVWYREYDSYGECSNLSGFEGPEALLKLTLTETKTVAIRVIQVDPAKWETALLHLADPCDPTSCRALQDADGQLTVPDLGAGEHSFIVEAARGLGTDMDISLELLVECH